MGDPGVEPATVVRVVSREESYPVLIRDGLLSDLAGPLRTYAPAFRYAVIADATVSGLYGERVLAGLGGAGLDAHSFTFPAGEPEKTREQWARLTDELMGAGYGRDSVVIALGGGVTGDLAGFVAATFMRGVPVVQVPTSLVAMVDASIGGKTGVDHPSGKNLVGAFHPPRAVLVDPSAVGTLPVPERRQGLAEALKHGAILDVEYLDRLERDREFLLSGDLDAVELAVRRSVTLKAEVVSRDERESGYREILNFGHTVGHALERCLDYRLAHGDAVSIGMVAEARIGERVGVTKEGEASRLEAILHAYGLPVRLPGGIDPDDVLAATSSDKKARSGSVRYVLLDRLGTVASASDGGWAREVADSTVLTEILRDLGG